MFAEELHLLKYPLDSGGANTRCLQSQTAIFSQSDLQYQICSTFMRHTGQKLSIKQTSLMEDSRKFIDAYATFKKKQIDSSRTLDTLLEQGRDFSMSVEEEHSFTLPRSKSPGYGSRKSGMLMTDQLAEIQQRCSYSCFVFISGLVAEYKKMESRLKYYENRQTTLGKREEANERFHQENLILRKKLEHQADKVHQLQRQVEMLREKNRSINSCINEKINSMNHSNRYFQINNKVYKDIKNYLQEKQTVLKKQSERITSTEQQILNSIENAFQGASSCQKCCQILRKLKEAIMKFRRYLQGQSIQFERLYDKYKKTMYSVKSRPSI